MKARARTALTSLVLLALAALAVAWVVRGERSAEADRAAKEREERLFAFEAKDVRAFAIAAQGGTTRVEKDGAGWRLTAPVRAEAERFAADAIAERLASLRRTREAAPAGDDGARFGLASPRVKVELELEGGRREALALGDESAFDGSVFARAGSGPVVVVPGELRHALDRGAFDLREKRVLRFERDAVAELRVSPGPVLKRTGAKGGPPAWEVDGKPADAAKVDALLAGLAALRALRFDDAPDAARAHGVEPPVRTVVLRSADGKELARLEVGRAEHDDVFVRSAGGPVAVVSREALAAVPDRAEPLLAPSPAPAAAPPAAAPGAAPANRG